MSKISYLRQLLVCYLLVTVTSTFAQQDTVLLFHPTISTLKTYQTLLSEVIDPEISRDLHFLGVYHTDEQYDYAQSAEYLSKLPVEEMNKFSLKGITGNPDISEIYKRNEFHSQFEALYSISKGAIFNGGPDIPPILYDEPMHLLTRVTDPWRHYMEVSALSMLLGTYKNDNLVPYLNKKPDFMVLGICLGMQTMNVATGGSLIQDIPNEIYGLHSREEVLEYPELMHRNYHFDDPSDTISFTGYHFHPVKAITYGRFYKLFFSANDSPVVLSSHHQAIQTPGKGLIPSATSTDDKIIEAIEHEMYPAVFGVQFHPEKSGLFLDNQPAYVKEDSVVNFKMYIKTYSSVKFHHNFWNKIFGLL